MTAWYDFAFESSVMGSDPYQVLRAGAYHITVPRVLHDDDMVLWRLSDDRDPT